MLRGQDGGDAGRDKSDDLRTDHIQGVGVFAGQQTADRTRRAGGRTVALHSHHGVHNVQPGGFGTVQVNDHPRKIHGVVVPVVVLRFDTPRHDAEHILGSAGHPHHAVRFQLAEVDYGVRLIQIGGVFKLPGRGSALQAAFLDLKVPVQRGTVLQRRRNAGPLVDPVEIGAVVNAAGAVADNDLCAAFGQQRRESRKQRRMGGYGVLRRTAGHQVRFDDDLHAGGHPVQPAQRFQQPRQGGFALLQVIGRTAHKGNVAGHPIAPFI